MKAYTDIEQSKKLAEFLPIETSDAHYVRQSTDYMGNPVNDQWSEPKYGNINSKHARYIVQNFTSYEKLPCWSLAALLEILPLEIETHKQTDGHKIYHYVELYMKRMGKETYLSTERHENLVDACVEMIIKLHELNLLQSGN